MFSSLLDSRWHIVQSALNPCTSISSEDYFFFSLVLISPLSCRLVGNPLLALFLVQPVARFQHLWPPPFSTYDFLSSPHPANSLNFCFFPLFLVCVCFVGVCFSSADSVPSLPFNMDERAFPGSSTGPSVLSDQLTLVGLARFFPFSRRHRRGYAFYFPSKLFPPSSCVDRPSRKSDLDSEGVLPPRPKSLSVTVPNWVSRISFGVATPWLH